MPSSPVDGKNKPEATTAVSSSRAAAKALVAAAKAGDEQAFEALVKRHQRRIFALAMRYTRVREDAEDIVQQTFKSAFIYLETFEGKSSFATWLTRIAINEALMLLRRGRALREVSLDDSTSDYGTALRLEISDRGPNPETSCLQRERAHILSAAMEQLTPRMRAAFELRELLELSTQETAQRMGLSVAAVKARLFHGRKSLRERLKRYGKPTCTCRHQVSRTGRETDRIPRQQLICSACN
ncbi:MAG: sigma-70 family RNA polymerase sigma factor [Candidatus Sulfotelmatobacter sp.]